MHLNEYQKLAQRTLSGNFFVSNPIPPLLHAAIGIATESTELMKAFFYKNERELDRVNIAEEIGDILWYVAVYKEYAEDAEALFSADIIDPLDPEMELYDEAKRTSAFIAIIAGDFLDIFKKAVYYKKPLDFNILNNYLSQLLVHCAEMAQFCKTSLEGIAETNIKKLQARYPEKFDEEKADKRDLEKEREVLENV